MHNEFPTAEELRNKSMSQLIDLIEHMKDVIADLSHVVEVLSSAVDETYHK